MKRPGKIVLSASVIVIGLVLVVLILVKSTMGSGKPYPDIGTDPLFPGDALEIVAELPLPPGNVAVSRTGRVFFNYHYLGSDGDAEGNTVFELVDGVAQPYPDRAFQDVFQTTLGMLIDRQNRLWIIDPAAIDGSRNTALYAFDLATDELVFSFTFPDNDADFAQDVQVTADGRYVIAADTGLFGFIPPKLLVLDTETLDVRVVLEGHESVTTQPWRIRRQDGSGVSVFWGLIDWQAGVDGITISPDGQWLSYGAINHDTLYRVPLEALLDPELSETALAARVEAVGSKPLSDGLSSDLDGNVYITDVENSTIARMTPDGELVTLVRDPRIRWADGISFGPDNTVYFTDSAISAYLTNTADPPSREVLLEHAPYHIFRFTNDIPGIPGS